MLPGRQGDWVDGGFHQNAFLHSWSPSYAAFLATWNDIYKQISLCNSAYEDLQDMIDKEEKIISKTINMKLELVEHFIIIMQ